MDIPRRSEIPELIQQIQSKQRGEKATALLKVMEEYRICNTFKAELGRQDILYKPPEQKQISDKE
jgi:hypothetical protein